MLRFAQHDKGSLSMTGLDLAVDQELSRSFEPCLNKITQTPLLLCQASCDSEKCRGIPCGCPAPNRRLKLDRAVGADLSCTPPIYRPRRMSAFKRQSALTGTCELNSLVTTSRFHEHR